MIKAGDDNPARDPATMLFYSKEAPVYAASGPRSVNQGLRDFLELLAPGRAFSNSDAAVGETPKR